MQVTNSFNKVLHCNVVISTLVLKEICPIFIWLQFAHTNQKALKSVNMHAHLSFIKHLQKWFVSRGPSFTEIPYVWN